MRQFRKTIRKTGTMSLLIATLFAAAWTQAQTAQTSTPETQQASMPASATTSVEPPAPAQAPASPTVVAPPQFQIIVSIPDRKLAFLEDGKVLKIYSVAVGADVSPSPAGEFTVTTLLKNPTYYHPGKVIPPGKENPLGTRWMGLSQKGYGIHGTNMPRSIGKAASHGCIRMGRKDLEELYALVQVGDRVVILAERTDEIAQIFGTEEAPGTAKPALIATNSASTNATGDAAAGQE